MSNPTLREGMESADGWVEYLQDLLNGHFFGRKDVSFHLSGGKFDETTKKAVEQYQRDKGFTGDDVDGVVGDRTWSALQGQPDLAPEGTDGRDPGTYVAHGKQLRFHPTEMGYGNGVANQADQLYFRMNVVGDVDVPHDEAVPFVHVEGPNGTTNPTEHFFYPGQYGPGGWFEVWFEHATNDGPAGRYRAIAQLPHELGGDTAQLEFDREVPV